MTRRFAQLVLAACVLQHVTLGGGIHPLDPRTFAAVLDNLANEGLGVDEYQKYVDLNVRHNKEDLNGTQLVELMAESLSAKFTEWIEAVERLRDVIESGYGDMTTTRSLPECCTAPLGEKDVRFKQRVNKELLCAVGYALNGSSVTYVNHDDVIRVMKENLETAPSLKWQYFSTEEGVLFDYPTFSYCPVTYDPRFRSWYVEVTSPLPKDLVIVVDTSDSMRKLHQGRSLMQIAIEAAATVVDTLGPNDRVGVVAFSDQPQTPPGNLRTSICYSNTLAMATPRNKHYLTNDFLMNLRADGGTHYAPALKKAFEYFIKTPSVSTDRTVREKAIIFLTDGEPTDTREVVMQTLRDENAKLGNKVTMFMFGLGEGSMWHTLNDMAMQTTADVKAGEVKRGHFIRVSDPSDLRSKMGSYYTYFSKTGSQPRVTFSVPYYDFFGIGVVISGCLPVFYDSQLKGVVCIDRTVSDLLSDVTYFNKGELNYAFVIDGQARVLTHPMLPRPRTIRDDPLFIRLPSLERSPQVFDVMTSMMRGESGTQTFVSQRVTSRGDTMSEGVDVHDVLSHYFWSSVALTWFSVCVVVAEDTEFVRSVFDKDHPPPFVYHRLDLRSPRNKCRHFNRVALRDVTSVKFAPTAFVDAYEYLDTEETKTMVDRYELYMAGTPNTLDSYFKDGVRESVAETFRLDAILSARPARYAIWRYIGTEAGVFRQLPGTRMLKEFDHTQQPWYKRSVSMKGVITLSTSCGDKAEAGSTVTLSRSIYQGRSSQQHTNKDPISAVMGMDIKMSYLYRLMLDTFPACSSPDNRCFVVDNSGFIVVHKNFVDDMSPAQVKNVHISVKEPVIARDLVTTKVMTRAACVNLQELRNQYYWKISLARAHKGSTASLFYSLADVPGTNVFVVIATGSSPRLPTGCSWCITRTDLRQCSGRACNCPCFSRTDIYDYCSDMFSLKTDRWPVCLPQTAVVSREGLRDDESAEAGRLDVCYPCGRGWTESVCSSAASCTWCPHGVATYRTTRPYCSRHGACRRAAPVVTAQKHTEIGGSFLVGLVCFATLLILGFAIVLLPEPRRVKYMS